MTRTRAPVPRMRPLPPWGVALAWTILLSGLATLPLGYFLGFETSSYPTPMKVLFGLAGALGGIGLLARRSRAVVPAIGFLMTQLPTVVLPDFSYRPVFNLGLHFVLPVTGGTLDLGVNACALVMLIGVAALLPAPAAVPVAAPAS